MHAIIRTRAGRSLAGLWIALLVMHLPAGSLSAAAQPRGRRSADGSAKRLEVYQNRREKRFEAFVEELGEIATYCDSQGLSGDANNLRRIAKVIGSAELPGAALPGKVRPDIPRDLPEAQRQWRLRYRKAREDIANGLYRISRDAILSFPSYAYQLVREAARFNPDHVAARRLLGYVRSGDRWVTPFEKYKAEKGEVWHEQFGWLPKSHVENYEKGLRYYVPRGGRRGNWIAKEKEIQLRRHFRNAWQIRTDHYLVKTNHSLEEGVRVAKALEDYYRYFFQTFAGFFNSREQMRKLFAGSGPSRYGRSRPYIVHYYRTKKEYVSRLKSKIPQIAITNGLYLTGERICHFFHTEGTDNTPTLYHESTHQIFYESIKRDRMVAERAHFWIIEGISCYMESFRNDDGKISMGDPKYPRFVAAKYRYVNDGYYVPLKQFAALGMREFQTHRNIKKNYSQASGLAKVFREDDDGKYRDALIEHISQLYRIDSRRYARVESLEDLTGVSYEKLDKQYGEFIRNIPVRIPAKQ